MADKTIETGVKQVQIQGALKGASVVADVTASAIDADHTGLDVKVLGAALPPGAATDAGGTTYSRSAAAERYHTVLGAPVTILRCRVYNSGAPLLYLVFVDQVAAPTTGVTACFPVAEVPGTGSVVWPFAEKCLLGGHVCLSTNPLIYTDPGAVGYFGVWS